MDLSDTGATITLISGLVVLTGVLGVVIPLLPGLVLCWLGVLCWALLGDAGAGRWLALALATVVAAAGLLTKYLWPGRQMRNAGVPIASMLTGGVLGVVGFFVVPVVGLVLGFVLGIWIAERARLGPGRAWPSTRGALAAVGMSLLIEFAAALGVAVIWVFGLVLTS
ncbi:DUF456 domain-containing protein [Mangrovihabitans endophyticus]|nr:DUF456 domain-containing protein [Mangrovihabitans endophyticus]